MAIVTELIDINGRSFTRTYSDDHRWIVREGSEYEIAEDPTEFGRTYTEGDLIDYYTEEVSAEEALDILMGGQE